MELGKHIRTLRQQHAWSQDELAEKIFVSRQTISNWENDKSYPDVHSLVLLSQIFDISVSQLIEGDAEIMKKEINQSEIRSFKQLGVLFTVLMIAVAVTPVPLTQYLGRVGMVVWAVIVAAASYVAYLAEKEKKRLAIQTYREITAFLDGETLDAIEKAREEGKRPYQTFVYALAAAGIALIVSVIMLQIF